jgi:hypothetical protein
MLSKATAGIRERAYSSALSQTAFPIEMDLFQASLEFHSWPKPEDATLRCALMRP